MYKIIHMLRLNTEIGLEPHFSWCSKCKCFIKKFKLDSVS